MSLSSPLVQLMLILVLGMVAQWLAWRLRWPAILLLLVTGILAGPVFKLLNPDALFGETLLPIVSLSVGLILFEGGLSLRLRELQDASVAALIIIGGLITWALATLAAWALLDLSLGPALLLGAILIVTGPTVILPLLRSMQLRGRTASILKWEGILNDPVGAVVAVLVFEAMLIEGEGQTAAIALGLGKALAAGVVGGLAGAVVFVPLARRYLIPDYLQTTVVIALVAAVFTLSNAVQAESGLIAVTLMGALMANQRWVDVHQIAEFKENLRVLLIAVLFIILAARMQVADLKALNWGTAAFIAALIFIVRPVSVYASTLGSGLTLRERSFLAMVAPRGVVAAAVTSAFVLELTRHAEHSTSPAIAALAQESQQLVPVMFAVIIGTIAFCAITSNMFAKLLGISESGASGYLILGANPLARQIAQALTTENVRVLLVDSNWTHIRAARMAGLEAFHGNILDEHIVDDLDLRGIGNMLAMTSNDEANSLAAVRFAKILDRANVYQVRPEGRDATASASASAAATDGSASDSGATSLGGRHLFGKQMSYGTLLGRLYRGGTIKSTPLSEQFDYAAFRERYGDSAIPLFYVKGSGEVRPFTIEKPPQPEPGQKLISLLSEKPAPGTAAAAS